MDSIPGLQPRPSRSGQRARRNLAATWPALIVLVAVGSAACSAVDPAATRSSTWRAIEVVAEDVPLDAGRPDLDRAGESRLLAGFALRSSDPDFGGFSGLRVDGDQLIAVSDQGHWWRATLEFDTDGRLRGLVDSQMAPLADLDGEPTTGRMRRDAEEIANHEGGLLVAFEGDHRTQLYRYAGDPRPRLGPMPEELVAAPENAGMEAVTYLVDGRLLVVPEEQLDAAGNLRAWLSDPEVSQWRTLSVATEPGFRATAAATLPDGDVLLLLRFFTPQSGARVSLLRLPATALEAAAADPQGLAGLLVGHELARFEAPLTVDNFEAVDIGSVGPDGRVVVFLLSDDNYSSRQRTLLFQLQLPAP